MVPAEHKVEAFYSSDGMAYYPVLSCSCGYTTERCDDWEDAGREFDGHRRQILLEGGEK